MTFSINLVFVVVLVATLASLATCDLGSVSNTQQEVVLRVGISLGLEAPANDSNALVQRRAFEGLSVWVNAFNDFPIVNRTTKDGRIISFELIVFENYARFSYLDPSHEAFMRQQAINMSYDTSLDFVLPPVGSPWGTNIRKAVILTGRVPFTIGIADSRELWYAQAGSYGAPTSALNVMSSTLPYLRLGGAETAYVIRMQETFQSELCQGFINQAPFHEIKVSHIESVPFDYNTFGAPTTDDAKARWDEVTDDLITKNADVLVMCDYGVASEYVISLLRNKKYTPKAIVLSYKFAEFEDQSLLEFVNVPKSYHADAGFPTQPLFVNSKGYDELISATYGHPADLNNAQATLTGFLLSNAILLAADNTSASIEQALRTSQFASFMGISRIDTERRQLMDNLIIQRIDSKDVVVGPAIAADVTMVYPMPTWDERKFSNAWGKSWMEPVSAALMTLAIAHSIGWIFFVLVHWNTKTIVAASPLFCILILVGSIIIYVGNIFWMPSLANDSICAVRTWLVGIGYMILFGSLIGKTLRIYILYYSYGLKVIRISNLHVLVVVFSLTLVQVILSILMMTVGKVKSHIHITDEWRVALNYYECFSSPALKYIYGVNLAYGFLILAAAAYLAYRVKEVPYNLYNEANVIHLATWVTALSAIVASIAQLAWGNSQRYVAYFVMTIFTFIGPVATILWLFVSKYRAIYTFGDVHKSSAGSNGSSKNHFPSAEATPTSPKNYQESSSAGMSSGEKPEPQARRTNFSLGTSASRSPTTMEMSVLASTPSAADEPSSMPQSPRDVDSRRVKKIRRLKNDNLLLTLEVKDLKAQLSATGVETLQK